MQQWQRFSFLKFFFLITFKMVWKLGAGEIETHLPVCRLDSAELVLMRYVSLECIVVKCAGVWGRCRRLFGTLRHSCCDGRDKNTRSRHADARSGVRRMQRTAPTSADRDLQRGKGAFTLKAPLSDTTPLSTSRQNRILNSIPCVAVSLLR